ncbi:MAG TPA: ABC transporter permease [Gemmatimonadaceae bacterium]|nr:ABC transporter permease [Gemmatimonadaceae bacterium]
MKIPRTLRRNKAYSALVIFTLSLGIGANTAIFSVINGVLLRAMPYRNGDRMVLVQQTALRLGQPDYGFSMLEAQDYRTQTHAFAGVDVYHTMTFTMYGHGDPLRVTSGVTSSGFFDDLGVRPMVGRSFRSGEDAIGEPAIVLLSYEFWRDHFAADPKVVGQTFTMNDKVHTIIGVLPPLPKFPNANDIYIPNGSCPFLSAPAMMNNRGMRMVAMVARLKPGVTPASAAADLQAMSEREHSEYHAFYPPELGLSVRLMGLREALTRDGRPTFLALLAMTVFLLAVSGANVANLTLARQLRRTREFAMRVALGADRTRLLRELMTESTMLAVIGGVVGLILAWAGLGLLRDFASRYTPNTNGIRIDGVVLLFTLGISVVTGLLFGAVPVLPARRSLSDILRDGGATSPGTGRGRLRATLVMCQVAIAFVLLVGAGLLARTLVNLRRVDPGYDASHVTTALASFNWTKYADTLSQQRAGENLVRSLRSAPGVIAVGIAGALPLDGQPAGRFPLTTAERQVQAEFITVGGDYFKAIGTPVLGGRAFNDADRDQQVVVVNQSAARSFWRGDPLGQRISADSGKNWFTVVGVVRDVRQHDLTSDIGPVVYVPFERSPQTSIRVLMRSAGSFGTTADQIRDAAHGVDPLTPVSEVQTLEALRTTTLASPQLTTVLSFGLALVALLLTAAGLGGVMAFTIAERTQELGIRLALGAGRRSVLAMVLRQGMMLVGAGLAAGLAISVGVTRGLSGLLFGVGPTDVATYGGVLAGIVLVTLVACLLPARRAITIDPLRALRSGQ